MNFSSGVENFFCLFLLVFFVGEVIEGFFISSFPFSFSRETRSLGHLRGDLLLAPWGGRAYLKILVFSFLASL